ncbi:hypothetical protein GGI25_002405 [Coemansia spiralis]|uniref:Large ribosomal subunit protein mL67 n=2 Tax=Coemansia TaxID=4863 RepID=A0A9W8G8Z8_9FUNG|nr:hypothetical protein BX070DRAFT_232838 [Coemansia spiralis]KAJ1991291.1 hypothetical protein EDC05_003510 [Coemansia umbellata]KAJ2622211.1 hypothetical protein GGI26_003506 [Coemansia sp. RSA 1358]KAJ2678420.1 hypothetical protein GGI25_002405 [Coemansia spiralis]
MSLGVYLFRNIRTNQILATTEKSILARPNLVKSQIKPNQRPSTLRPDHWIPLVAATGFESKKAQDDVFMLASQNGHPLIPPAKAEQREYLLKKNKDKKIAEMDMVERQVAQLARTFIYIDKLKPQTVKQVGAQIKLFWQDRSWIKKIEDAGLYWPEWVAHDDLELKRGSIIVNPELRSSTH